MFTQVIANRINEAFELCRKQKIRLVTAESCTGGMLSMMLTSVGGSSDVFERGLVTYSNEAKQELLGVPAPLFSKVGAVSAEVATAMAQGALKYATGGIAISITGIAGPGTSEGKPVGLVYIALAWEGRPILCRRFQFSGDRGQVRMATVEQAIEMLVARLKG